MASEQLALIVDMMKAMRPATEPSVQEARASLDALTVGFNLPEDVKAEPVDAARRAAEWIATPEATARAARSSTCTAAAT